MWQGTWRAWDLLVDGKACRLSEWHLSVALESRAPDQQYKADATWSAGPRARAGLVIWLVLLAMRPFACCR